MARGVTRILTSGTEGQLYRWMDGKYLYGAGEDEPEQIKNGVSWKRIESASGAEFSVSERKEIFECTNAYARAKSWIDEGASEKVVRELHDQLLTKMTEVRGLARRFQPHGRPAEANDDDTRALDALAMMCADKDFALRDEFHAIGLRAGRMVRFLSNMPEHIDTHQIVDPEVTARSAERVGLEAFICCVLEGADALPRPKHTPFQKNEYIDFYRWGIRVGQKSSVFRRFTNVLLKTKFTDAKIREAHRAVRSSHGSMG